MLQRIDWPDLPSPELNPDFFDDLVYEFRDSPMSPYSGVLDEHRWQRWGENLHVQLSFEITIRKGHDSKKMMVDFVVYLDLQFRENGKIRAGGVLQFGAESVIGELLFDHTNVKSFRDLPQSAKDEVLRCLHEVYQSSKANADLLVESFVQGGATLGTVARPVVF